MPAGRSASSRCAWQTASRRSSSGCTAGVAADRFSRKRLMIGADLVRGAVLVPVAVAGLAGVAAAVGLVVASFVLESATSYFAPAYGATIPTLVDRRERPAGERARAGDDAGALDRRLGSRGRAAHLPARQRLLRRQRGLVLRLGAADRTIRGTAASTIRTRAAPQHLPRDWPRCGRDRCWPPAWSRSASPSRSRRGRGSAACRRSSATRCTTAPAASRLVMAGYAAGSIVSGIVLARLPIRRKARASLLAWVMYLPGYGLSPLATSLPLAVAGAFFAATGAEHRGRAAELGSAGGGARPAARSGARRDLAHAPRRARDRRSCSSRRSSRSSPRRPSSRAARPLAVRPRGRPRSASCDRGIVRRRSSTELEHARGVEPVDPEHRPGRRGRGAGGHQPDELRADDLGAARLRLALDPLDDLVQRRRLPVLDVHRHLHEPGPRQVEAEGAHARGSRRPARGRPPRPRARRDSAPRRLTLNAISGRAGADDHAAGGLVQRGRPEVGHELARRRSAAAARRGRRGGRTPGPASGGA